MIIYETFLTTMIFIKRAIALITLYKLIYESYLEIAHGYLFWLAFGAMLSVYFNDLCGNRSEIAIIALEAFRPTMTWDR